MSAVKEVEFENIFKKKLFIFLILIVCSLIFVSAAAIGENLHLNVQTTDGSGNIVTGTYNFTFNISADSSCANVIYTNRSELTTDTRGVVSYYLENVALNFSEQYWLCYYRNFVLQSASKIARTPYTFRTRNITVSGIEADANLEMGIYNVTSTGTGFFSWLGNIVTRITKLFVQDIDFSGNINGSGNITTTGRIGIGTESPSHALDVRGIGNFSGGILINNVTNIATWETNVSTNWTKLAFNNWNDTWDESWFFQMISANVSSVNTTLNIQNLYNDTLFQHVFWNRSGTNLFPRYLGDSVGIGTTSPTHTLNVQGSVNITGDLILGTTNMSNISNVYVPYNGAINNVNLGIYNLTTTGRVGIGTSSPTQKLHVEGNANVTKNMTIGNALVFTDVAGNMVFRI